MKINFAILWVDDNKDIVESLRPRLTKWMDDQGLGLVIHWHPGEAGVYTDLENKEVELIVLDYKLKGQKNGDQILSEIRSKGFYEDIIFYTTNGVPNNLFSGAAPDGVYFVDKKDAFERIKDIIELKIRRASNLVSLRGWIVADSIELEARLLKVLNDYFKKHELMSQERAIKVLSEDGAFFFGRLRTFLTELLKNHVAHLTFSEDGIFDFGAKHKILNGLVKDHIAALSKVKPPPSNFSGLQECKKILDSFPQEIIEIRNALAHQMAEIGEAGQTKIKTRTKEAKEITINLEQCILIRKSIRKHFENIKKLEALI